MILFVVSVLSFYLYDKNTQKKSEKEKTTYTNPTNIYAEKLILLSIKYNIPPEKTENIISSWQRGVDKQFNLYLDTGNFSPQKTYFSTIEEINKKNSLPQHIIASIIIDYELLTKQCEQ